MNHRITFNLAALASLALASCVSIPDRPLSPDEQRLVGTWTTSTHLPNVGQVQAVAQIAPNRTSVITIHGNNLQRTAQRRWELIGDQLRESSGLLLTSSRCRFINTNSFQLDDSSGNSYTYARYSSSPQVNVAQALAEAAPERQLKSDEGSWFENVAPGGRILKTGSPEWIATLQKEIAEMDANRQYNDRGEDGMTEHLRRERERNEEYRRRAQAAELQRRSQAR